MHQIRPFTDDGVMHATLNGHRFHLRLGGAGEESTLWVNGTSPPLLVDRIGAEFIGYILQGMWKYQTGRGDASQEVKEFVIDNMYRRHGRLLAWGRRRVTRGRIAADLDRIYGTLMAVAEQGCPVAAGLELAPLDPARWTAPARMDLALTYRCDLDCGHCYMGGSTRMAELSRDGWNRVYDTLWRVGVPQVLFTGGEPTEREDLVDLVRDAERFVTGLVTNGRKLAALGPALREASLDYAQVTLLAATAAVHDRVVQHPGAWQETVEGIRTLVDLGMNVVTNTTLTRDTAAGFTDLLRFGAGELGLRTLCCNAIICSGRGVRAREEAGLAMAELRDLLAAAKAVAGELGVDLQWYSPTCYLELDPLALDLGLKSCSAAGHNMTVRPDGRVLPCQSWPEPVGHILETPWREIWEHPVCHRLRHHEYGREREECAGCRYLEACGGGCPLEREGGVG